MLGAEPEYDDVWLERREVYLSDPVRVPLASDPGTVHGLIATARGMCTDELPHEVIDAQLALAVDAVKDFKAERDHLRGEVARLREVAIEHGGCFCTWDLNDDGEDYICRPADDCPVHVALARTEREA